MLLSLCSIIKALLLRSTISLALHCNIWCHVFVFLRFNNLDIIRQSLLRSTLASWIVAEHNLYVNPKHTLAQIHVANRGIDKLLSGLAGSDHVAILELHRLSTSSPNFAGHN